MNQAFRLAALVLLVLGGCSTVSGWFGSSETLNKPSPLPEIKASMTLNKAWEQSTSAMGRKALDPVADGEAVYVAGGKGEVMRLQLQNGHADWKADLDKRISAGVGLGGGLVLLGTYRGEVYALDGKTGKKRWESALSSEIAGAPVVAGNVVVVRTGDGNITGLSLADGTRKWLYTHQLPTLRLEISKGLALKDGVIYAGFAGGKLVAIDASNGAQLWEASVAIPHGATELERVTDVAGTPAVDSMEVCAVAYQGRVACFDRASGTSIWNRETSSDKGIAMDEQYVYVTDDKGTITAYDKGTGRAVWRQDKLSYRGVSAPLALGKVIVVGDFEGYLHVISTEDGSFAGRAHADGGAIPDAPVDIGPGIAVQTENGTITAFKLN
jgi:outer membrane protein assembly factor BamB